jgi:exodeoxyribonuclease V gamma subunit
LIQLQGRLHGLVRTAGIQAGLLDWRGSEPTASDTLRFWVHHLALCAAQPTPSVESAAAPAVRSRMLYAKGALGFVDCANARALLAELVDCFMNGQAEPLNFFPKTSRALAADLPTEQILQCWEGRNGRPGEREDPAIALAFRSHFDCLDVEFETLANRIWKPLLDHLRASEGSR